MVKSSAIVVLGASGDLSRRKLIPSLSYLYNAEYIDRKSCVVIGNGRTPYTDEEFRRDFAVPARLHDRFYYHTGYEGLYQRVQRLGPFEQILIFFSLPPSVYAMRAETLKQQGFVGNVRLVIEKPFGYDQKSAYELAEQLNALYPEKNIYRIDHYLAKEMIQNLMVQRFDNRVMAAMWHCDHLQAVELTSFEEIGVEDRGAYFDDSGILRDMVQNHLLQILVLATMEQPASLAAEDVLASKIALLRQLKLVQWKRYQYEGYRQIPKVNPESCTETYAELEFRIDNPRWQGVPLFVRTGKKMPYRRCVLTLQLRANETPLYPAREEALFTSIQPTEGLLFTHQAKVPGMGVRTVPTAVSYSHDEAFGGAGFDAYARLLYDALCGDRTLFVDGTENNLAWDVIAPALNQQEIHFHPPGICPTDGLRGHWLDVDRYLSYYGF